MGYTERMTVMSKAAIKQLSMAQRQELLETICEVMAEERLSNAERKLTDARLDEYYRHRKPGKPAELVIKQLLAGLK